MKCKMDNVGGKNQIKTVDGLNGTKPKKVNPFVRAGLLAAGALIIATKVAGCSADTTISAPADVRGDVVAMDTYSGDVVAKDTIGPDCNPQAVEYLYIKTKDGKDVIVPNDGTGTLNGVKVKVNQDGTIEVEGKVKYGEEEKNVKVTITPKEDGTFGVVAKEAESGDLLETAVVMDSLEFDPSAVNVWTTDTQTKYSSALLLVSGTESKIVILDGFDTNTEVTEVMSDGTSIQVNIKNVLENSDGKLVLLVDSKVITPSGDVIEEKDVLLVKGGVTGVPGYTVSSTAFASVLQVADVTCNEIETAQLSVDGETQQEMTVEDIIELENGYALQVTKIVPAISAEEAGYVEVALLTPEGIQEMGGGEPVVYVFERETTVKYVNGKEVRLVSTGVKSVSEETTKPTESADVVSTE